MSHLPTSQQLADILTKILPSYQFNKLLSKLGVFRHLTPSLRGDVKYTKDIHHTSSQGIQQWHNSKEQQLNQEEANVHQDDKQPTAKRMQRSPVQYLMRLYFI